MLPLKLVRSLVSGDDVTNNPLFLHIHHDTIIQEIDGDKNPIPSRNNKFPLMLFVPTQELVKDSYRLASIARAIGMDLNPNPSLAHIIFSWPPPPSSSSSTSWNDTVPLPFPSFATASLSHLRQFANLSRGFYKLAFVKGNCAPIERIERLSNNNWHCSFLSLFCVGTNERIGDMDRFSRVLLGRGWALFRTGKDSIEMGVYLYRKIGASRISELRDGNGDLREISRVRELRLPPLDFGNVALRILQYILLMTDDVFYLA